MRLARADGHLPAVEDAGAARSDHRMVTAFRT